MSLQDQDMFEEKKETQGESSLDIVDEEIPNIDQPFKITCQFSNENPNNDSPPSPPVIYTLTRRHFCISGILKAAFQDPEYNEYKLPNGKIKKEEFEPIIEYLQHRNGIPGPNIKTPCKSVDMKKNCGDKFNWEAEFIDRLWNNDTSKGKMIFFGVIFVTQNFFLIDCLRNLLCCKVAAEIKKNGDVKVALNCGGGSGGSGDGAPDADE
jgi:hypothetical protein